MYWQAAVEHLGNCHSRSSSWCYHCATCNSDQSINSPWQQHFHFNADLCNSPWQAKLKFMGHLGPCPSFWSFQALWTRPLMLWVHTGSSTSQWMVHQELNSCQWLNNSNDQPELARAINLNQLWVQVHHQREALSTSNLFLQLTPSLEPSDLEVTSDSDSSSSPCSIPVPFKLNLPLLLTIYLYRSSPPTQTTPESDWWHQIDMIQTMPMTSLKQCFDSTVWITLQNPFLSHL